MSAWIVSKAHIDLMVKATTDGTRDGVLRPVEYDRDALGQLLLSECVASVSWRYPDDKPGELPGPSDAYYVNPYRYTDPKYNPTAAEFYKAVTCYEYQSCEHPGWKDSAAFAFCEQMKEWVAAEVPACAAMREARANRDRQITREWAEFEAAPWGWDEADIALRIAAQSPTGRALLLGIHEAQGDATPVGMLSDFLMEGGYLSEPLDVYPQTLAQFAADVVEQARKEAPPAPVEPPKPVKARTEATGGTHVRVLSGSRTVRIIDMTNAGKRGKMCRRFTILDHAEAAIDFLCTTPAEREARGTCYALECRPVNAVYPVAFDVLVAQLREASRPDMNAYEDTIRGVDSPRPLLTAGIAGRWSASADEDGVHIRALNDVNEWTEITHKQTPAKAYEIARRVWSQVQRATSRVEASNILSAAGCRLHGFCGMD